MRRDLMFEMSVFRATAASAIAQVNGFNYTYMREGGKGMEGFVATYR